MPTTLEQVRLWLTGENVDGLPDRTRIWPIKKRGGLDMGKMAGACRHVQYTMSMDGSDAVLLFGKYRGQSVSVLVNKDEEYCRWMLNEDFPPDLIDVVAYRLKAAREERQGHYA